MNAPRETVYAALFKLVSGVQWTDPNGQQKFQTVRRRLVSWSDVPSGQQPSLCQRQKSERGDQAQAFGLERWKLSAQLWIYQQIAPDVATIPAQFINPIVDAIDAALAASGATFQTLGVPITNAWIDGEVVEDDPVYPDQQAVIVIPVSILTAQ